MHAPIVATAPRLFEAGSIDEHDPLHRYGHGLCRDGQALHQQPQQEAACLAQLLLPGDVGQVGQTNEHRPRTQLAKGGRTQDVGQQPAEQIGCTRESSGSHKGSCPASMLLRVGWQLGEHLLLPSFSDEIVQLRGELWQAIMVRLGHRFLLNR